MNHQNRMRNIGRWAIPPKGSVERQQLSDAMERRWGDPIYRKRFKKRIKDSEAVSEIQRHNGAALPADKLLREMALDYTNRARYHGLDVMQASFNLLEAFVEYVPPYSVFFLRDETRHLVSFEQFFDFVTSSNCPLDIGQASEIIASGRIYTFSSVDDPAELLFQTEGTAERRSYCFKSASLIKFDNEINVLLEGGERTDLMEATKDYLQSLSSDNISKFPGKEDIEVDPDLKPEAVALEGADDMWRTYFAVRMDLDSGTVDARAMYQDCGNAWVGGTDDVSSFMRAGDFANEQAKNTYESSLDRLRDHEAIFEIAKMCVYLPMYVHANDEEIWIERYETGIRRDLATRYRRRASKILSPERMKAFVEVNALIRNVTSTTDRKVVPDLGFSIDTRGYWKPLKYGDIGQDKQGREIRGRTWVTVTESWYEHDQSKRKTIATRSNAGANEKGGYIYCMRSAAHDKDIFKVGYTTREPNQRAAELSGTNTPDNFLIVDTWLVSDCIDAEKLIHDKLSKYRINPKREFFRSSYPTIQKVISDVIENYDS